jgi:uncharacterized protein (DUF1778 family)
MEALPEMNTRRVTIRLTEWQYKQLKAASKRRGESVSDIVRQCIVKEWVRSNRTTRKWWEFWK